MKLWKKLIIALVVVIAFLSVVVKPLIADYVHELIESVTCVDYEVSEVAP